MYYLTFTWPAVQGLLERHGFEVRRANPVSERRVIVEATKRG